MRPEESGELLAWRRARRHPQTDLRSRKEFRSSHERDRDRLLYSSSLRRLAVVTQVLTPTEGFAGHNRLTHALKVAQVARRLAQKLSRENDVEFLESLGGLDLDVAECAGLAHDLGHPPFGHVAEEELDELVIHAGLADGFEGNAQSFRIVSSLEIRKANAPGLDLTRATLGAILKYPWLKGKGPKPKKYGAYQTEQIDFDFARENLVANQLTLEAQVMDWADDITYSAHDLEDFFRAGKIPLHSLAKDENERKAFLEAFFERKAINDVRERKKWEPIFDGLAGFFPITVDSYDGSRTQKAALRGYVSSRIQRALETTTLENKGLVRNEEVEKEVELLKHLTMHYVILTPSLKAQQHGHREIIRNLFLYYLDLANDKSKWPLFPPMYRELLEDPDRNYSEIRIVADLIAGMGEQQAIDAYRSVTNVSWSMY